MPRALPTIFAAFLGLVAGACKSRPHAAATVKDAAPPSAQAGAAAALAQACAGNPLFLGVGEDGSVSYQTALPPAQTLQPSWDASVASWGTDDLGVTGWLPQNQSWPSSTPWCLVRPGALSSDEFAAALGCTQDYRCDQPENGCDDGPTCDPTGTPPDSHDLADTGPLALVDDGLHCELRASKDPNNPKTWYVVRADGTAIGSSAYGVKKPETCQGFLASRGPDQVCAWTSSDYATFTISTGKHLPPSTSYGLTTDQKCNASLKTLTSGVLCAWTGNGYSPVIAASGAIIGSDHQSRNLSVCAQKLQSLNVTAGVICSWDGKQNALYSISSGQRIAGGGSFASYETCAAAAQSYGIPLSDGSDPTLATLNLDATDTNNYMHLWYPQEWDQSVGFTLAACRDPAHNNHIIKTTGSGPDAQIPANCRIDTLYSWGNAAKLAYLKQTMGPNVAWTQKFTRPINGVAVDSPLYTTQSPVASFAYGDIPVRIKLRPDVKYKLLITVHGPGETARKMCGDVLKPDQFNDTVLMSYWDSLNTWGGSGLDFILCSPGPIESWSYQTKRHYDEVVKDLRWISAHGDDSKELYWKRAGGVNQFIPATVDGKPWDWNTLASDLRAFVVVARQGNDEARLYYNPAVGNLGAERHFQTNHPIYYNEK